MPRRATRRGLKRRRKRGSGYGRGRRRIQIPSHEKCFTTTIFDEGDVKPRIPGFHCHHLMNKIKSMSEGVLSIKVRPFGGDRVLLTFLSRDAKEVDPFRWLGNLYGHFVSVDSITQAKSRLDFVRVLLLTDHEVIFSKIITVDIEGSRYHIFATEEPCSELFQPAIAPHHTLPMSSSLGAEFLGTEDVENDVTSNVEGFISKSMDDVALENGTPGSPCHMNSKSASSEASISHSIEDKLLESRVSLPLNFQEQELCHQPINDIHDPPVDTVLNSNIVGGVL
ncbi:hypothetical protein GH714_021853 [Hevea brasiliensis]|uniref:Uncharacterized protein n=1 Tax=Hevea brasiliensis TaxID=3981 RepID=A0A6A6LII4_HEVBR|nr:hypothetical protein GH714_021853 [Hevea brasiliensis]